MKQCHVSDANFDFVGTPADSLKDRWSVETMDDGIQAKVSGAILTGQGVEVRWEPST